MGAYTRNNPNVVFVLPALAIGIEEDGSYFIEVGWFCWAIGICFTAPA